MVGFLSDGRLPIIRMKGAATPAKGAAHIWQRGPCGRRVKMPADATLPRMAAREEVPPELLAIEVRARSPEPRPYCQTETVRAGRLR